MIVVGFNWYPDHDHAVGVIVDGESVFASEEERWTRHKHSPGEPPINALKRALLHLERIRDRAKGRGHICSKF